MQKDCSSSRDSKQELSGCKRQGMKKTVASPERSCQDLKVLEKVNNMLVFKRRFARLGNDTFHYFTRNLTCFSYFKC